MQRGQAHERLRYLRLPMISDLDGTSTNEIPTILQLFGLTFRSFKKKGRQENKESKN